MIPNSTITMENTGLGDALDISLEVFQASGANFTTGLRSRIDENSFTIQFGSGSVDPLSPTSTSNNSAYACLDPNPKGRVFLDIPLIPAGETAVIRCLAIEGDSKTQIIDDKVFGGPLMKQYQQAMQWLKGKLSIRYEIEGGGPRKEVWEVPETALKEAITNALCHRDYYDKGAKITIEVFKDRVEISNPGGLTSAISPSDFGTRSHSRNPLIFGLFVRIRMVEQVGSGIGRIKDQMKEAKLPQPEFKTDGMFTVVLHRTVE
jgi:hypothetical protein